MTEMDPAIMLVEDDADVLHATSQMLRLHGYDVLTFGNGMDALDALDRHFGGVVIADVRMPRMSGVELLQSIRRMDEEVPVILISGHADVDTAVAALKDGAWDFISKPVRPEELLAAASRATTARQLVLENRRLRALAESAGRHALVGESQAIRRIRATLPILAESDLDVVVEGATGTGKQLVARLLHEASARGRSGFVSIDCAGLPTGLEDALFRADGSIARSHRGTLFLDNLDGASERLQRQITGFVERRTVGVEARSPVNVDTRIIAAIGEGGRERLQSSLFHKLAAMTLRLPPLSERIEDVPALIRHFIRDESPEEQNAFMSSSAFAALTANRLWPGNVRELAMAVARHLRGLDPEAPNPQDLEPLPDRVLAFERTVVVDALTRAGGDVTKALEQLKIPRETLYYRLKRLDLSMKDFR
jgi:two-component system, NtrC family, C4-dicarboxylate transport response regulator DctD